MLPVVSSLKNSSPRPGLLDPSASPCDVWRPGLRDPVSNREMFPGIVGRDSGDFFLSYHKKMLNKNLEFFFPYFCSWHFYQHFFFGNATLWQFA